VLRKVLEAIIIPVTPNYRCPGNTTGSGRLWC
jgi:hypothetical protein